jgi:hypothetical protein
MISWSDCSDHNGDDWQVLESELSQPCKTLEPLKPKATGGAEATAVITMGEGRQPTKLYGDWQVRGTGRRGPG